jgi:peptidoglycan hydrolase-like protein with peptidoglycan-binding domain
MELKAFRFRYDEILEDIVAGNRRLLVANPAGPFEEGRHIGKIQQALLDLGYPLPLHGKDFTYGPETASVVSQFKIDERLSPTDGVVGTGTMRALDAHFADEVPFPPPVPGVGEMTLDDFLEAVQAAEQANGGDSADEFVTRLRQLYYPGTDPDGLDFREAKFDQLLPNAPIRLLDGRRRILTPHNLPQAFFQRLSARAPENPTPSRPLDNPSPYFFDATGTRIDLGHVILTVDALRHPGAGAPYTDFGIPEFDVASWPADLGIAAVWAEKDGEPEAPTRLPRLPNGEPDFDGYYLMSAPEPDLIGDIDGVHIARLFPAASLASALVPYYLDGETAPGLYRWRFRMFLTTLFGTDAPLESDLTAAITAWTPRIDRFNDLFSIGPAQALFGSTPPPRSWIYTQDALATFLQWLMDQARIERDRFD